MMSAKPFISLILMLGGLLMSQDLIPLEDFFRNPQRSYYQLSPNGKYLSYLKPWKDRMNIHIQTIGEDDEKRISSSELRDIMGYFWANDKRVIYIQDSGGDENWKLYGVDIDGENFKELTPFDKVQVRFVDDLEDDPDHMLISLNKRNPQIFDVYKIEINSGKMEMVAENPGNVQSWVTDNSGDIRAYTTTNGVDWEVYYREDINSPFKVIEQGNFKDSFSPLFFTFDNREIYISSNIGRDKQAIYKYNPESRTKTPIFEHDEVDVSSLLRSKLRQKILGVRYTTDKSRYHFFDKEREDLQKFLESKLPGYEVAIASFSKDEKRVLVVTYSDKSRGSYYFYNREDGEFIKLVDLTPWLDESRMADMKPVSYKSRDGLTIHGYLTLPNGTDGKDLPIVVNPHGGPWARDNWGFNPEVQYLANRGYGVLQINFRGSTGYGKEFLNRSFKEWGGDMQNDITDGVNWLISEGIADRNRIAIYGASYGGYATLAGVTFTPDLYRCGIDYVGVSSIFSFFNSFPPYWKPYLEMMYEMVGHPEKDKELLKSVSPLYHVDKIKVPLFIAQGANDPRVPISESDQIVKALKERGIDVPYMVKDNEGHGFMNEENRFDFYRAMEKFLDQHMK
jgi:dipeptidyl aminopeptidase/acylaminoacyl peptidase